MRIAGSNLGIVALVVLVVSEAGCTGGDRPKTVPIAGRVTIDGQPPGEVGRLYFTPTQPAEGYSKRPANGSFDVDGTYRVMSWEVDDGLVPGHYTVNVLPGKSGQHSRSKEIPSKRNERPGSRRAGGSGRN